MPLIKSLLVVLALALLNSGCGSSRPAVVADAIYVGGPIVTVNDAQPNAEALAVKDGKILAVGSRVEIEKAHKGKTTAIVDLAGKTLMPGFIDGHTHILALGAQAVGANLLPAPDGKVDTIDALVTELQAFAKTPEVSRTGWIFGLGYDDSVLGRHPTKADLDRVSTTVPVGVIHISGHFSAMNSVGLAKVGITAASKDPVGGTIRRLAGSSEPDGVLEELAHYQAALPVITPVTKANQDYFMERALEMVKSFGYTTVNEGRMMGGQAKDLEALAANGKLDIDVVGFADFVDTTEVGVWGQEYKSRLRMAGIKIVLDGSPQGRTAWRTTPYLLPPPGEKADYRGSPNIPDTAIITAAIANAYDRNWQVKVHANGDAAIDQLLEAVGKVSAEKGVRQGQVILIHGQFIRSDQILKLKALGIFPSMFPMHTFYWGDWYKQIVGEEQAARISPMRSILNTGLHASSHTDAPVALPNLMQVVWATVNRTSRSGAVIGPDERVTPAEAMKMITLWGAEQFGEQATKGSLEAGKLADLVILDQNPLTVDPMTINKIVVLETIKEGKTVYKRRQ